MKNLQPICTNPARILNPHLKELILRYKKYHTPSGIVYLSDEQCKTYLHCFPFRSFRNIKANSTSDELTGYYVIDCYGDVQPLFLQVPCGKCELCREKKANEWVSRAMCETQSSTNIPYFVTLTYNDLCLPRNGVRKRAAQLFMKRLRINMARETGESFNLRFFLCAEYGTNSGRPHYHLLLWNVPYLDYNHTLHTKKLQDVVQKSWSFMVNRKYYDKLPDDVDAYGYPVYKYIDDKANRCRAFYGYTTCSECNYNRVRYCMKYMRKDSEIPFDVNTDTGEIKYKNDIFFLSSRRRGLGYQWISEHLDEYRNNPAILDVKLTCKFTQESYTGCLPRYYKDIIAPPPSRVISKDIRDMFADYNQLYDTIEKYLPYVNSLHQRVIDKYPSLCYVQNVHAKEISSDIISSNIRYKIELCEYMEWQLLSYEYDDEILPFVANYKHLHSKYIMNYVESIRYIPIEDRLSKLRYKKLMSKREEKF